MNLLWKFIKIKSTYISLEAVWFDYFFMDILSQVNKCNYNAFKMNRSGTCVPCQRTVNISCLSINIPMSEFVGARRRCRMVFTSTSFFACMHFISNTRK